MVLFKTLRSNHLHGFLKLRRPPALPLFPSASSLSAAGDPKPDGGESTDVAAKPGSLYSIFAKPSVVARPGKPSAPDGPSGKEKEKKKGAPSSKPSNYRPMEEKEFPEVLSPETAMLVSRLHEEGYLKDANFSNNGGLEPHQIPATLYSRHFLKSAAEKFGQDHQEIAKAQQSISIRGGGRASIQECRWLSGSDLKRVAVFGCPSVERNTVFAAKRLRSFFRIEEDITCRGCKLKTWCKFMNQRVSGGGDKVILSDVMRVITLIALDSVPRQLLVPDELKSSVGKMLKEVVNLSK